MAALILFVQVVFVIGAAFSVYFVFGPQTYAIMAAMMTVVTLGLITSASKTERDAPWWALTCILVVTFGLFWPSLPAIAAWGAWSRRAESPRAPDETTSNREHPADNEGPRAE